MCIIKSPTHVILKIGLSGVLSKTLGLVRLYMCVPKKATFTNKISGVALASFARPCSSAEMLGQYFCTGLNKPAICSFPRT